MYDDIPPELRELIEPVVRDHGLELVDVELARGRPPWRLCITVDTPEGDGRVSVERCAWLSREIETQLDAADLIGVSYRLEVSSPGLDRRLGRRKDFEAAVGSEVKIETRDAIEGRKRFRGRLVAFAGEVARLALEEGEVAIPFRAVARAQLVYRYSPADFERGASRGRSGRAPKARAPGRARPR